MHPNEDEDIPTFEDLVEQVRTEGGLDDNGGSETDSPGQAPSEGDVSAGKQMPADAESEWQWGGGAPSEQQEGAEDQPTGPLSAPSRSVSEDASHVLVLGPAETDTEYELCAKLCNMASGPPQRRILVMTDQAPDERLQKLRALDEEPYEETAIIVLGDQVPSRPPGDPDTYRTDEGETVTVEKVRDPLDYTRLGLLINKHLPDQEDEPAPAICFHTLTTLLELGGSERLLPFLSVLHGQAEYSGAPVHFHLDPTAVSPDSLSDFQRLVGASVRFDADGIVSVDS